MDRFSDDSNDLLNRFNEGVEKFNNGEFFECHDIIEDIWFEIRGSSRNFYQGIIHLAVGFYHITVRNNPRGALSQLNKGIEKLDRYTPEFNGVELSHLIEKVKSCIIKIKKLENRNGFPKNIIPKISFNKKKFLFQTH